MSAKLSQHMAIRSRDLVAGPLVVQLLEDALEVQSLFNIITSYPHILQAQVEHLLALLSKHSRECFECQCNNSIYKQLDLKFDQVLFEE